MSCSHWQSEYDASPCVYCELERKASLERAAVLTTRTRERDEASRCAEAAEAALAKCLLALEAARWDASKDGNALPPGAGSWEDAPEALVYKCVHQRNHEAAAFPVCTLCARSFGI